MLKKKIAAFLVFVMLIMGSVTTANAAVLSAALGDVDADGSVDAADALFVLRASVNLETLTDEQFHRADMNGDGKSDSFDALTILRMSVSLLDTSLTVGKPFRYTKAVNGIVGKGKAKRN